MAEQHVDPQALLALLDELGAMDWGQTGPAGKLGAMLRASLLIATFKNALPTLDAGVRALVGENERLSWKLREWDNWYEQSERTAPPKERRG